jgi:hypothetical protein
MVDAAVVQSPGWWLEGLGRKLAGDQDRFDLLWAYYDGDAGLPAAGDNVKEAYKRFQKRSRTNWAELVVEAPRDRMTPIGFRTAADGDDTGDDAARELWASCDMDEQFADLMSYVLAMSRGYLMVDTDDDAGHSLISVEDPRQVVTDHDPRLRSRVRAGLKVFRDEPLGEDIAVLILDGKQTASGRVEVWEARRRADRTMKLFPGGFRGSDWEWVEQAQVHPSPVVPIIRCRNINGRGEYEKHLDLLDRINTIVLQKVVIAVMQAFRQRAVIGDLPETDRQGNRIDYSVVLGADAGALWTLPEGVEMWESANVDLGPILMSVRDDLMALAAVTRTPMHMFLPETVQGSAEGASLAREGLTYKTEDRMVRANVALRKAMSLAFMLQGDEQRARLGQLSTIWAPPERLSLAERASANAQTQDIPFRSRMTEVMRFQPEVVERMEAERMADAVLSGVLERAANPEPPAPAGQPAQQGQQQGGGQQRPAARVGA